MANKDELNKALKNKMKHTLGKLEALKIVRELH